MKASICIVNLNARKHLGPCLSSLKDTLGDIPFETIVVDNHSWDGSNSYIQSNFPETTLIENKRNEGYTRAMNQAMGYASGEFVILLNPDSTCEPDALKKLINFMETDPSIGICGPKVLNADGTFQKSCRRGIPRPQAVFSYFLGLSNKYPNNKNFTGYHLNHLDENEVNEVEAISGSCSVIRKDVIDEIGFLDERFVIYQEDSDYCFRAKNKGWKIVYYSKSIINHIGGAGGTSSFPFKNIFEWHRSYYKLYIKYFFRDYSPAFNFIYFFIIFSKLILTEIKYLLNR